VCGQEKKKEGFCEIITREACLLFLLIIEEGQRESPRLTWRDFKTKKVLLLSSKKVKKKKE
jgi:hypothetical protein